MRRLPAIREIAMTFANVDPIKDPIPVVPTLHYQMGGIPTNYHGQVITMKDGEPTIVPRLYAVGECAATSVHGANRLGTNSLLDLIVFGRSAGNHIVESRPQDEHSHPDTPQWSIDQSVERVSKIDSRTSGVHAPELADEIRHTMQEHCGVFRTVEILNKGVEAIDELAEKAKELYCQDKSKIFNTARVEALEVANMIEVARATAHS